MDPEVINNSAEPSFSDVLRGVGQSAKELVIEQTDLVKTEVTTTLSKVGTDLRNTLIFGGLFVCAIIPVLFFLIFGLAEIVGSLWLSSLIVAVVWGAVTGTVAYRFYQKLIVRDTTLPATRKSLDRATNTLKTKMEDVKDAITN